MHERVKQAIQHINERFRQRQSEKLQIDVVGSLSMACTLPLDRRVARDLLPYL